jgi:creatinine amidohydrolase
MRIIDDIAASLLRQGIRYLAIINGHGGNYVLGNVAQEASVSHVHRMLLYPSRNDWNAARVNAGCQTDGHADMHGGELETSLMLYGAPELVRDGWRDADHEGTDRPDLLVKGMHEYTTTGIIGRPSLATAHKGAAILDSLAATFEDRLTQLRMMLR